MSRWLYPSLPLIPPSFLPSSLTSLSGLTAAAVASSSSRICTPSPSFQVIDVPQPQSNPSAQQQQQQQTRKKQVRNNSALSVLQMFCRPPSGLLRHICSAWWGHGHHAPLDCQVWHHLSSPRPVPPRMCAAILISLLLGLPSLASLRPAARAAPPRCPRIR